MSTLWLISFFHILCLVKKHQGIHRAVKALCVVNVHHLYPFWQMAWFCCRSLPVEWELFLSTDAWCMLTGHCLGFIIFLMPNAPVLIALFYSEQSKHFFPLCYFSLQFKHIHTPTDALQSVLGLVSCPRTFGRLEQTGLKPPTFQ